MPGLVKTPPNATPVRILVPTGSNTHSIQTNEEESGGRNPNPRSPPILQKTLSPPSASRYRPSPNKKKSPPENPKLDESALENPDLSPFLLKLTSITIASGESANKALDYTIRASKSFERCAEEGKPRLELAMSLHVVVAIYYSLGRLEKAMPVLERAIGVPEVGRGAEHALAKFSGYMQLGDTHSMLGQLDRSIACYEEGSKIQMEAIGETDLRVAETCR
ncbi:hypothetical protein MRB53_027193 [Persea americana]|uniref:Uncharacterized protein n=1 Tax=Persea americana TaxID=3435 RepID=A0ACC2LL85_PERAE|nr:hypothetical protein MRB53_027193 [Persea americana]|eukprot:TRINITY_DN2545_c0_g1_i3.p1 TRINITY_DN2545_c0_g1~~TRINITY_DN2545_c0_g1_i3.p1  ORF type:complete len:221 (-),score=27.99 TRINITY_DN2545_c0_g1_i3:351-1013(-)